MNYHVQFFKVETENNEKGKPVKTGELTKIGDVTISDEGISENFTLAAKAFRHAAHNCTSADKLVITKVGK